MFSIVAYSITMYVVHCMSLSDNYNIIMYSSIGTSGRFCYFKTSTQSCDDGKPQYSVMKLTGMCSMCNFTTFAFTSKISFYNIYVMLHP